MTTFKITYATDVPDGTRCLVPGGMGTPQGTCTGVEVAQADTRDVFEDHTGQRALLVTPRSGRLQVTYHVDTDIVAPYPEVMFTPRDSRFTRFADELVAEVGAIAPDAPAPQRARAIACATAERFSYGHPEEKFNDGLEEIPALGCGLVEGSCVDINTYFIASLRAAGIEAGYVTGFFFPQEKAGRCTDGHCWVASRIGGAVQHWDIAHHLKMGTRDIHPALDPRPGLRAACFHSMGLDFPELGLRAVKALIEPVMLTDGWARGFDAPEIRLHHPALTA